METKFCPMCGSAITEECENNGVYFCSKCECDSTFDELLENEEDFDDEDELPDGCEVVCWPKSQYLMEHEDFEDLELLPEHKYGPCAYMVESDWLKENFPNLAN